MSEVSASEKYADIIGLERPVSKKHAPMSNYDRAAQFSPFAALTGYEDLIRDAAKRYDYESLSDVQTVEDLDVL